jgi:peptidyl-prolyl cis-trans isomerase C
MKKMNRNWMVLSALLISAQFAQAGTLATVNGKVITDADLNAMMSEMTEAQKSVFLKTANARQDLINKLVDQELVFQDAQAKKIESSQEYQAALSNFKKQAMMNILVQKTLAPKVTTQAIKAFYEKNKIKYNTDQVHAQHVLLATEKEAKEVLAEVSKPNADFQKIAESKSKDPSAKNNRGDLGYFSREGFEPAFVDAAFSTKVGEISGPVKTIYGYHVIKVLDYKIGKTPELAEVEQRVRLDLQRDILQTYVAGLRGKAKIK